MNNLLHTLDSKVREGVAKASSALRPQLEETSAHFAAAGEFLKELSLGDYTLKPLDSVLFSGTDPVATIIKRIELHEVVPKLTSPFHDVWTHAGILVDKSVLPLPFLEEGKMYLYESVFSGTVLGYTYSRVLPVDHQVSPGGNRLGPQIRDFEKVVDEGTVNVGIAPLSSEQRRFVESKLKTNPNLLLDLYHKYKDYGYPIKNLLSVVSAASENLRHELNLIGDLASKVIGHHEPKKDTVFCSELVSIVYKEFGLPTFIASPPETFTPLEVEVAHEFDQTIFYAKENGVSLMKHNRVKTGAISTQAEKLIKSLAMSSNWVAVKSGIPEGAQPAGEDVNGKKLFIARVKIGSAYYLGKIREDWSFPLVTYYEREVPINFGHEVLANLTGMKWVDASHGDVPGGAVKAGIEEDGSYLYISRAIVGDSHGILGVGKKAGAYAPGTVAKHLKNARIPFGGKEVKVEHYQVLCHD